MIGNVEEHEVNLYSSLRRLVRQIPPGRVATCGSLAGALGDRVAARWVGSWALRHQHDDHCTCHRIVRADGRPGAYIGGPQRYPEKLARLADEGIQLHDERIDLATYALPESYFAGDRPLRRLRRFQEELTDRVRMVSPTKIPRLVGGIDVSFASEREAVAAFVLVRYDRRELVWSTVVRRRVDFPYITSYLAFREVPVMEQVIRQAQEAAKQADVILVDGSGRLHPKHAGSASHLGVVADVPTIGVTKRLLCGKVQTDGMRAGETRPVLMDDETVGAAILPPSGTQRPLFVSPGHRVDIDTALRVVRRMLSTHRLPEPIYWADRLSRQQARKS